MNSATLISKTVGCNGETAEEIISYCARVSNPANQKNYATSPKLLKYCIEHKHWSIFEMAGMCVEIETTRAIAQQILRHRSFSFQEFSQRYAEAAVFERQRPRRQDPKNRQNSTDDLADADLKWFLSTQIRLIDEAGEAYKEALRRGIAKESARFLLPLSTQTTIYMSGSARSWVHYIQTRTGPETQLEHREVALECKKIFCKEFPHVAEALGWAEPSKTLP